MKGEGKSNLSRIRLFGRGQLATRAAVLLPVVLVAGLSGWALGAPESAKGQSVLDPPSAAGSVQASTPANATPAAGPSAVA